SDADESARQIPRSTSAAPPSAPTTGTFHHQSEAHEFDATGEGEEERLYQVSAICSTFCDIHKMTLEDFLELMQLFPVLERRLFTEVARARLRRLNTLILERDEKVSALRESRRAQTARDNSEARAQAGARVSVVIEEEGDTGAGTSS